MPLAEYRKLSKFERDMLAFRARQEARRVEMEQLEARHNAEGNTAELRELMRRVGRV